MNDKETIEILKRMLDKYPFEQKERDAILSAIGILGWTKLGESRIKNIAKAQKTKHEKLLEKAIG